MRRARDAAVMLRRKVPMPEHKANTDALPPRRSCHRTGPRPRPVIKR
jgi:hypothetical protein